MTEASIRAASDLRTLKWALRGTIVFVWATGLAAVLHAL